MIHKITMRIPFNITFPILISALSLISLQSSADTIWLVNGDHISGEIQEFSETELTIKTDYNPAIIITLDTISSFATDQYRHWKIDQVQHEVKIEAATNPHYVLINNTQIPINSLTLANIEIIPKWKKYGHLDASIESSDKENHKKKLHLDGELNIESEHWRHKLKSEIKREQDEEKRTEDNAEFGYSLDYLFNENWLLRSDNFYREDNIDDKTQYTYVGIGPGYRFWGNGSDKLDFITTYNHFWLGNNTFSIGLNAWALAIDYKKFWFEGKLETFSDLQVAFPDLKEFDRITNMNVGLRYLLTQKVYLSLKYELNETKTVLGTNRETSYIFGAGFNF